MGELKAAALAENLRAIAPYTELEPHAERITEDNFASLLAGADVICEAFDRPEAKAMLVNGVLERFPDKHLVAASGMAGFDSANRISTRRVTKRFYLCGDGTSDVDDGSGLVSSRVLVCAAHEAHMIIRLLTGGTEP